MAIQRYYSGTDRTRRMAGVVLALVGALLLALLVRLGLGGASTALILLAVVPVLLIGIGVHFLRHVVAAIDVDLAQRRYSLIRDGRPGGGGMLDELGPLRVSREERIVTSSDGEGASRTVVTYDVKPAGIGFLSLYSMKSPGRARRKMEAMARRWRLSCRSLDGPVRAYEHLDAPLHVRLRDDADARRVVALDPQWKVKATEIFRGHALVSTHRSWEPLAGSIVFAVIPIGLIAYGAHVNALPDGIGPLLGDPLGRVLLGLGSVVACVLAWKIAEGLLDTFRPGTIEINDRGVSYRWRRMAFDRIEEVTAGHRIEIVGDRRVISIAASFCPHAARRPVAHELQRLILEAATRRGLS